MRSLSLVFLLTAIVSAEQSFVANDSPPKNNALQRQKKIVARALTAKFPLDTDQREASVRGNAEGFEANLEKIGKTLKLISSVKLSPNSFLPILQQVIEFASNFAGPVLTYFISIMRLWTSQGDEGLLASFFHLKSVLENPVWMAPSERAQIESSLQVLETIAKSLNVELPSDKSNDNQTLTNLEQFFGHGCNSNSIEHCPQAQSQHCCEKAMNPISSSADHEDNRLRRDGNRKVDTSKLFLLPPGAPWDFLPCALKNLASFVALTGLTISTFLFILSSVGACAVVKAIDDYANSNTSSSLIYSAGLAAGLTMSMSAAMFFGLTIVLLSLAMLTLAPELTEGVVKTIQDLANFLTCFSHPMFSTCFGWLRCLIPGCLLPSCFSCGHNEHSACSSDAPLIDPCDTCEGGNFFSECCSPYSSHCLCGGTIKAMPKTQAQVNEILSTLIDLPVETLGQGNMESIMQAIGALGKRIGQNDTAKKILQTTTSFAQGLLPEHSEGYSNPIEGLAKAIQHNLPADSAKSNEGSAIIADVASKESEIAEALKGVYARAQFINDLQPAEEVAQNNDIAAVRPRISGDAFPEFESHRLNSADGAKV